MHTRRRGSSGSDKPSADEPPGGATSTRTISKPRVVELAEQGHDPSQIGMKLRDEGVTGTPSRTSSWRPGRRLPRSSRENDEIGVPRRSQEPHDPCRAPARARPQNQQDFRTSAPCRTPKRRFAAWSSTTAATKSSPTSSTPTRSRPSCSSSRTNKPHVHRGSIRRAGVRHERALERRLRPPDRPRDGDSLLRAASSQRAPSDARRRTR